VVTTGISPANQLELQLLTKPGGPFRIVLDRDQAVLAKRVRRGT
jgi:hypothetical protein